LVEDVIIVESTIRQEYMKAQHKKKHYRVRKVQ